MSEATGVSLLLVLSTCVVGVAAMSLLIYTLFHLIKLRKNARTASLGSCIECKRTRNYDRRCRRAGQAHGEAAADVRPTEGARNVPQAQGGRSARVSALRCKCHSFASWQKLPTRMHARTCA